MKRKRRIERKLLLEKSKSIYVLQSCDRCFR